MEKERSGERMKLGAFFHPTGNHVAAWLHPDAQIDAGTNFRHYAEITQTAERGRFDLMFVADAVATRDGKLEALSRWPQYMAYFDPLTLLPALAAVTTHIGLCATATTSSPLRLRSVGPSAPTPMATIDSPRQMITNRP